MAGAVTAKHYWKSTGKSPLILDAGDHQRANSRLRTGTTTQMVKQHDAQGHFLGVDIRVIYGHEATLNITGERTAYIERTNLTSRHMNARLTRKTLGFSKQLEMLHASSIWEDAVYNLTRPVKTLRREVNDGQRRWLPQSPALKANLTDHVWSIRELLTRLPAPTNSI